MFRPDADIQPEVGSAHIQREKITGENILYNSATGWIVSVALLLVTSY